MELHRLPADEDAVRRYIEDLWLPYQRDLETTLEDFSLADRDDIVDEEYEFRLERLETEDYRAWVAVEEGDGTDGKVLTDEASDLVGFVTTEVDEPPTVFDRPDRLVIGDIYVDEDHRGTGLARELVDRVARRAREVECAEVRLDVDVGNERAIGFYEKMGFEPYRYQMTVPTEDL